MRSRQEDALSSPEVGLCVPLWAVGITPHGDQAEFGLTVGRARPKLLIEKGRSLVSVGRYLIATKFADGSSASGPELKSDHSRENSA